MDRNYSAIVAAGGEGRRFGRGGKLKEKVGGKSVLSHSLDVFDADENCTEILLSASKEIRQWIAGDPLTFTSTKMQLLDSLETRALSVAAAARQAQSPLLVIQDATRPNFGEQLLGTLLTAVKPEIGAVPGFAVNGPAATVTTIGNREAGGENGGFFGTKADHRVGHIMEHLQGEGLCLVQTPQVYNRESFVKAIDAVGDGLAAFEDDSALYIAGGFEVAVIASRLGNLALTTEDDLHLLYKLVGGPKKKSKDRYSGLGW